MAGALSDTSIRNLSGTWVMNKTLSTDLDAVFKLQGVRWVTRKTIAASSATLRISQGLETDSNGLSTAPAEWMVLEPALAGGFKGVPEKRSLTWTEIEHNDTLFGRAIILSHYIDGEKISGGRVRPLVELQSKNIGVDATSMLTEAVTMAQEVEAGAETVEKAFMHDFVRSVDGGWTAEQIWAVEVMNGEKLLTRKVVVLKGSSIESAQVFYKLK
ncbi:hypothetical protein BDV40DRAFT_298850 [Aspergillus tamarii]|uniref:Calycin-like protein n=1 Tax=Aspergillus tamarii TaxID=41984 RepID=A0A5N6UZP8_ASPTM|nr:hypothetical protein BDV40DRAFT_298850 [Aspergillus tamarii]